LTRLYTAHVDLYDRAFGWDIAEEVDWLLERLGPRCGSVLEPGCGTGRYLEAFEIRGVEAVGIDNAVEMVEAAGRRGNAILADMAEFELGRTFDGAVCAVGTLALLSPGEAARHLDCMGRHLKPGGRYFVQLAIRDPDDPESALHSSVWEQAGLRVTWSTEEVDFVRGLERQRSRVEIVEEERVGEIVEEDHMVTTWTPTTWARLVEDSRFDVNAVYDGEQVERPGVELGSTGRLLWHELVNASRPRDGNGDPPSGRPRP
jgi:SAM-dependent methyltransferase